MISFCSVLSSTIFILCNFFVACYIFLRMIRALSYKNKLISEIKQFNLIVNESRQSLNYISDNIQEVIKKIQNDLAKEIEITHHFTSFEEKLLSVRKRFLELQELSLEYMRMNPNMRSIKVETPEDINEEIKEILSKKKQISETTKTPEQFTTERNKKNLTKLTSQSNKFVSGDQHGVEQLSNRIKKQIPKNKEYKSLDKKEKFCLPNVLNSKKDKLNELNKQNNCNQSWVVHE